MSETERPSARAKTALVCGAGGFIGGHLVKKLKREGYWVRGVDIKHHEFAETQADEFLLLDLREPHNCWKALNFASRHSERAQRVEESRPASDPSSSVLSPKGRPSSCRHSEPVEESRRTVDDASANNSTFDEVYQLAADMGGMGFIHSAECDIMRNSALINNHMIDAAAKIGVPRYFFSSSVCVYRDMEPGEPALDDDDAYPALPDNEYGWEKLYAERMALAYARHYPLEVRIARFQNCYGPDETLRQAQGRPGGAVARKPPPPSAARLPWRRTVVPYPCGATAAPCAPTPTSTTWSRASTC